jgi:hypothetical protein
MNDRIGGPGRRLGEDVVIVGGVDRQARIQHEAAHRQAARIEERVGAIEDGDCAVAREIALGARPEVVRHDLRARDLRRDSDCEQQVAARRQQHARARLERRLDMHRQHRQGGDPAQPVQRFIVLGRACAHFEGSPMACGFGF